MTQRAVSARDIVLLMLAVLAMAFVLMFSSASIANAYSGEYSWAGSNRYDTAAQIADTTASQLGGTTGVIVVSGENYPDALVASSLSGLYKYPILLTQGDNLPYETRAELSKLSPQNAIIVGGTGVVSSNVESELAGYVSSGTVTRFAGASRIGTAESVFNQNSGWGSTIIICSGRTFADATSISPYAASSGYPILLTNDSGDLDESTKGIITNAEEMSTSRIIICGGTSAVSQATEDFCAVSQSTSVIRLGGSNRYDTSAIIATWCAGNGLGFENMAFADGANFPDALAGSALQGANKSVLVLVHDGTAGKSGLRQIVDSGHLPHWWRVFGGESAVSSTVRFEIQASADGCYSNPSNPGVRSARYCLDHVGDSYSQDWRWEVGVYDCSSLAYRSYTETYAFDLDGQTLTSGYDTWSDVCYSAANEAKWCVTYGKTVSEGSLKPGDWIFYSHAINGRYKNISHVSIYVGDGMMVQAVGDAEGVRLDNYKSSNVDIYGRCYQ